MSHPQVNCPVCKMGKFLKETRRFRLHGMNNPDAMVDAAICATCGFLLLRSGDMEVK